MEFYFCVLYLSRGPLNTLLYEKVVPIFLFMAVMLFNAFMVHSLKHEKVPFLNMKSVEAMAWEEMDNPYWEGMRLIRTICICNDSGNTGETLQCSYLADTGAESCGDGQHGLDRCYENGQIGVRSLCETFSWWEPNYTTPEHPFGAWIYHP